jgi:hypothetical protein
MGTHQPNILNHFTRTEDMGRRGRVNGQQAVGSEPTGAGAPAPAHGHVANPDASVPAEGAVPTEEQKARIARNKAEKLHRKAECQAEQSARGRAGAPASASAPSTAGTIRQVPRAPAGLGEGMAAQGNSESWGKASRSLHQPCRARACALAYAPLLVSIIPSPS